MSYIKGSANKCSSNVWHIMDAFISVWTNWQRSKASSVHHDVIFFHGHKMASWLSTGCAMPELPGAKQAVFPGASFISKFGNFLYLEELGDTQWVLLNLPGAILNWNIKKSITQSPWNWSENLYCFYALCIWINDFHLADAKGGRQFSQGTDMSTTFSNSGGREPKP